MRISIGAIIVSAFATAWVSVGARSFQKRRFVVTLVTSILISLGLIYASAQIPPAHPQVFNSTPYTIAVCAEAILIFMAVVILRRLNRKQLLLPIISIIVGLHFFGMVPALGSNMYWWIGGAMCALSMLTLLALPQRLWNPVIGLGCAAILWTAVICALF